MTEMTYLEIANLNENARCAAVREVTDQEMLEKFVRDDISKIVRGVALNRITDPLIQAKYLKDLPWEVRQTLVCHTYDYKLLVDRCISENDRDVLCSAKGRLKEILDSIDDTSFVENTAVNCGSPYIREMFVRKVSDQKILAKIAFFDNDSDVRRAARKCMDQNTFEEALLAAPPAIKRRNFRLYLKIKLFGTYSYRNAKKLYSGRKVTPLMLQKLESNLPEWDVAVKECAELEAKREEWKRKIAKTENDILSAMQDLQESKTLARNDEEYGHIKASYEPIIVGLQNQKKVFEASLQTFATLLEAAIIRKEEILNVFREAENVKKMYGKHDETMETVSKHQAEDKRSLEQTLWDTMG